MKRFLAVIFAMFMLGASPIISADEVGPAKPPTDGSSNGTTTTTTTQSTATSSEIESCSWLESIFGRCGS